MGWNAALVYDTPAGAQTSIQILEYANSQLLEFRHYDEWLTRELAGVYGGLKHRGGILRRWKMRGEALRLNGVTVEMTELAERSETAIKFVSDMYSARLTGWLRPRWGCRNTKTWSTRSCISPKTLSLPHR